MQRLLHWRGIDPDRIEAAYVVFERDAMRAHGTSLTPEYSLQYRLVTDARWVTRELALRARSDAWERTLVLRRGSDGHWTADRAGTAPAGELPPLPDLADALDCDLALCPLTNTMPILRHDLVERAHRRDTGAFDYVMAWISVPDLTVHRSAQRYAVSDPVEGQPGALVRFATEDFSTTLEVDGSGLVVNYPGLARRIESIS